MAQRQRANKNQAKRSTSAHFRLTPQERYQLVARASEAGLSLSDFIRTQALNGRIIVRSGSDPASFELAYQLKKIGVNLNQMAHHMNAGSAGPAPQELADLCLTIETYIKGKIDGPQDR